MQKKAYRDVVQNLSETITDLRLRLAEAEAVLNQLDGSVLVAATAQARDAKAASTRNGGKVKP